MKSWSWRELKFKIPQTPHLIGGKSDAWRSCVTRLNSQLERARFPDRGLLLFPASVGNNAILWELTMPCFSSTGNHTSKERGKIFFWHPFFLVLWHSPLLPQYYCLSAKFHSAKAGVSHPWPGTNAEILRGAWHRVSVHVSSSPSEEGTTPHQQLTSVGRADKLQFIRKCPTEMEQQFY